MTNGLNQLNQQLNGALMQNANQTQNGAAFLSNQNSIIAAAQIMPNQTLRTSNFNNLNVQPLIKPVQPLLRNQPIQPVAPIVYSFAQPDYSTKLLKTKKLQWTDEDDDLSNLLG